MKGRKIVIVLIIINLILVGIIYSLINKGNVNNKKQIIKEMTGAEYEDNITELNQSHEDYANYIEESKKKIASAITEMGVETSKEATPETMSNNIRSIEKNANSINNYSLVKIIDSITSSGVREYEIDFSLYSSILLSMINVKDVSFSGEYEIVGHLDDSETADISNPSNGRIMQLNINSNIRIIFSNANSNWSGKTYIYAKKR